MMNDDDTPPMSTSTPSVHNTPLDKLSYKELQVLAMSLNLPGKMKQGVLLEAIRARQNQNETAVAMILEANHQRKLMKRQEQQQTAQQQMMRYNIERAPQLPSCSNVVGSSRRKSAFPRPRMSMKRPASEMDIESYLNDENMKRSKLVAALTQLRRPPFYNHAVYNQRNVSCATWEPSCADQQSAPMATQLPVANRPLPDLSKDLSILPALNDCSTTATPPSSDEPCGSIGNPWSSVSNNPDQAMSNATFDSCDSGWVSSSADESYDSNGWRSMPNNRMTSISTNNPNCGNVNYQNSSNINQTGYYEDQTNVGLFNNSNSSDDFVTSTPVTTFADFIPPAPCQLETCQKSNWGNSSHRSNHNPVPLPIAVMTSRLWFDCYDANCYHKNAPLFRVQRPGNPGLLFVHSGRSFTLPTFCNTVPRISSYVQ